MGPPDKSAFSRACIVLNANKPREAAERAARALEALGVPVEIVTTRSAEEGARAAQTALVAGADCVVAAGGDGTVMSVLEPVATHRTTLALVPLGTANDFATHLGIGRLEDALATISSGVGVAIDLVRTDYVDPEGERRSGYSSSSAGLGVMGRLAELEESRNGVLGKRMLGNGVWPFLAAAATLTVPFARARIVVDGDAMERDIGALEVLKLPAVGGFELLPDAHATSGMLHAWIAEGTTRRELVHTLRCALAGGGKLRQSRHLQHFSRDPSTNLLGKTNVQRIDIETTPPLPLHLNGDFVGTTPATFRLEKEALRVLVPRAFASAQEAKA